MTARVVLAKAYSGLFRSDLSEATAMADFVLAALDAAGFVIVPKVLPEAISKKYWDLEFWFPAVDSENPFDRFNEFWSELLLASQPKDEWTRGDEDAGC
jgi:hypothetical protein